MRRILLTCITAFITFPLFAQNGYSGTGFYRVQNRGEAGRYLSIQNDKVSEETKNISLSSGTAANTVVEALTLIRSKDKSGNEVMDKYYNAGSVLYISGNADGFTIEAQGMNTDELLRKLGQGDLKLKMSSQGELYTTYDGMQIDLIDYDFGAPLYKDGHCGVCGTAYIRNTMNVEPGDKLYALWSFKRIDNENEYFAVNPSEGIETGGKYYTTLFTSFAYKLSDGMKAYYISSDNDHHIYDTNHVQEPIAELIEIPDGKIPAATPVIIECSSNKIEDNKVSLLSETLSPISGNALKGRVFCYIPTATEDQNMKNALEFNKNSMRVIGLVDIKRDNSNGQILDSKLGFVSAANEINGNSRALNNGYIPANKVYLSISSSDAAATANGITLLKPAEYAVAASISKVMSEDKSAKEGIYTLTGVKVKEDNNTNNLPRGIYIINGKKQVIR